MKVTRKKWRSDQTRQLTITTAKIYQTLISHASVNRAVLCWPLSTSTSQLKSSRFHARLTLILSGSCKKQVKPIAQLFEPKTAKTAACTKQA